MTPEITDNLDPVKISVVCPTYNAEKYILATLGSVFSQTIKPFELIISDDGSSDKTVEIVGSYIENEVTFPVIFLKNFHQGPGAARNRGLEKATGDWIAFLDADDLWTPDKLAVVKDHIRSYPQNNFFCHDEIYVRLNGRQEFSNYGHKYNKSQPLPGQLFLRNFFSTSAVTLERSIIERAGFFDERLPSSQDYELWLRMSPYIKPFFIKKVLGYFVEREGSISSLPYWQKYYHRLKIAFKHKDKATFFTFIEKIIRLTLSKSWFSSLAHYFGGRRGHN